MKEKTADIDILEEELRKDILYQIDMQLYDEFNDKFCEIEENLGTVYSYKDLEDLKKAESDTERTLLREAISNLIAENKEKDEEIENQDKTIDRLVKEQEEREKYTHQLEAENKELKEENEGLKTKLDTLIEKYKELKEKIKEINEEYNAEQKHEMENTIPKSKVKEKIKEVDIQLQKLKDELTGRKTNFVNKNMLFAKKEILQSLLGKE